jgi:multidrug resistance efflux pump
MNEKQKVRKGGWKRIGLAVLILLVFSAGAFGYWDLYMRGIVSTDDARFSGLLLDLSSPISGTLTSVLVNEGDPVKQDQLLFSLDKRPLEANLEKAKAIVASERVALAVAETQYEKLSHGARPEEIEMAEAAERRAAAQARLAAADWNRVKNLNDTHVLTEADRDKIKTAAEAAKHAQEEAQTRLSLLVKGTRVEDLKMAQSTIRLKRAQLKAAEAAVDLAEVNLKYAEVYAPFDGVVVRRWQDPSALVPAGRPVLTLFDPSSLNVSANIEEKNIGRIAVGDRVEIEIDAYPDVTLTGKVAKILRATNSQFSLIPAEGSSGTFIKVAQRVPVKIVLDSQPDLNLGPGLSVEIKIFTAEYENRKKSSR